MSKNRYVIIHGQFYEMSEDELMHWKYVKREKKNGKWVYTYDAPGSKQGTTTTKVNDTDKWRSSKTTITSTGSNNKTVIYNRGKAERIADTVKSKLGVKEYFDNREKDWYESKDRAAEKAVEKAKKAGATVKDTDKWGSSKTTYSSGATDNKTVVYNRGKKEQFIDTAKEYIKDRLGYDERDALNNAAGKYEHAQKSEKNFSDFVSDTTSKMGTINPRDGSITYTDDEKKRIETMQRQKEIASRKTTSAGNKASAAADAYFNTPLGKLEKAHKAGQDWLDKLTNKRKKKNNTPKPVAGRNTGSGKKRG
jgi:hypothetical protein